MYQLVRKYTLWRKLKMIEKFQPEGEILDIGCATGQFLHYMAQHGWKSTGIEPDEKTRNHAITEYGLQVFPEDRLNSLLKASFDVISMWHVLEHVSDLQGRMDQVKNLLKPEGTLIVAVPNCDAFDARKYKNFWAGYDLPRHLYHFGPYRLDCAERVLYRGSEPVSLTPKAVDMLLLFVSQPVLQKL